MNNPQRNDVFEDQNGNKVAVKQLYPPNALGVCYVEYKNFTDSDLRYLPKEEFCAQFSWVDNFGTNDSFRKITVEQEPTSSEDKNA
jgi:hypothetical protein